MNHGEGSFYDDVQKFLKQSNFTENLIMPVCSSVVLYS